MWTAYNNPEPVKRTPRVPSLDWNRIVAKRLRVLGFGWRRPYLRVLKGSSFRVTPRTKIAGGMRHYINARMKMHRQLAKRHKSRPVHPVSARTINRPIREGA